MKSFDPKQIYAIWKGMMQRCRDNPRYKDRGIKVCRDWQNSKVFISWCISNGWGENMQIDRINNSKGYLPENCRFVSPRENSLNRDLDHLHKNNKSGYRGISYQKDKGKYLAQIMVKGKTICIGNFESDYDAVEALNNYKIENNLVEEYGLIEWDKIKHPNKITEILLNS